VPVTIADASEARKSTAPTMSVPTVVAQYDN
jgi:hypothetical protein